MGSSGYTGRGIGRAPVACQSPRACWVANRNLCIFWVLEAAKGPVRLRSKIKRALCLAKRRGQQPSGLVKQEVEEGLLVIAYGLPPACYYGENDHSGIETDIIGRRKGFSLLDLWIFMSKS